MRGLAIRRIEGNFDDLSGLEDRAYDAAFFFQSLHHCLRPWELIAQLRDKLKPGGIIGFCGEPIQSTWWKHWGLRLDPESLYAARGMGWFESGWSRSFITDCFARNGLTLDLFEGGSQGGLIGIASADAEARERTFALAERIGAHPTGGGDGPTISSRQYASLVGDRVSGFGRPAFRQRAGEVGVLVYGP